MERLHQFAPEKINWIFEQTEIEAEERRRIKREVNAFVAQGERRGILTSTLSHLKVLILFTINLKLHTTAFYF